MFFAGRAEPIVRRTGGRLSKGLVGGWLAWFMVIDCHQFVWSSWLLFRDYPAGCCSQLDFVFTGGTNKLF